MWLALCKFPILFSIMKLKLGYNFSNSSIDSKFEFLNVGLKLWFQSLLSLQTDKNWDF